MIQKLLKTVYLVVMTASLSLLGQEHFDEIAKRKGYGKAEITLKDGTTIIGKTKCAIFFRYAFQFFSEKNQQKKGQSDRPFLSSLKSI